MSKRNLDPEGGIAGGEKRRKVNSVANEPERVDTTKLQTKNVDYTVLWVCAIVTEYVAARTFLDREHERPENQTPTGNFDYTLGQIGKHNVVVAVLLDGEYGESSAVLLAGNMLHSFPNIRICLMVGIGGGAPSRRHDIRLGDVVVGSLPDGSGGVFQYNFGNTIQKQTFQTTGFLGQPPAALRIAVNVQKAQYESCGHQLENDINIVIQAKPRLGKKYSRPNSKTDKLYRAEIAHNDQTCCCLPDLEHDESNLVARPARTKDEDNPAIHYGLIASSNQLVKDALVRDRLIAQKDVLCFEVGAAGLINQFPGMVIRSICDYSDSHRSKEWQGYAAMTAAAYAKDLLRRIPPSQIEAEKKITEVLQDIREIALRTQQAQEREKILNWLTPIDYGLQQNDNIRRRHPGTGQWLIDSGEYQHWLRTKDQTLFCTGMPGTGKTILTSVIIEDLNHRCQTDANIGLAYVYLNFKNAYQQHFHDLICSLVKQLARGQRILPGIVTEIYDQNKRPKPLLDDITKALHSVAAMYPRLFIVVDALDECQESSGCLELFLSEIFQLQNSTGANIFATSRPILDIAGKFQSSIQVEVRASEGDILRYLDGNMSRLSSCVKRDPSLQNEVKTGIMKAADGMFLLAQLHFDAVVGLDTPKAVKTVVTSLATGSNAYSSAYTAAMKRIEGQNTRQKERAIQVLLWVSCTKRQLTPWELQHALAIEPGTPELDIDNIPQIEDVLSVCAGLVTVDSESGIIRLLHSTTQEYFDQTRSRWFSTGEYYISSSCITYLSFRAFETGPALSDEVYEQRLNSNPFYDYAAHNWGNHALASSICIDVTSFVERQAEVEASIQALLVPPNYLFRDPGYSQRFPRNITGLHLVAYLGLSNEILGLLDRFDVELADSWGRTPLSWAAWNSHEATVRLLLEKGADIETKDIDGRTPLFCTALNNNNTMVRLLLDKGANVDTQDRQGRTLWMFPTVISNEVITRLLLDKGANVDTRDCQGMTPLLFVVVANNEAMARLLLNKGADIEAKDTKHWTPLWWAARKGYEAVVRLLLDKGADIETQNRQGWTPVWWAARNGHEATVRLLLERGANVETKDCQGWTPVWWAVRNGHEAIVRLLLDNGADIKTNDRQGRTPLSYAAGNETMMQLLAGSSEDKHCPTE